MEIGAQPISVGCAAPSPGWIATLGRRPGARIAYEFTLSMAFIYPFVSLFIVWVATAQDTSGIAVLEIIDLPLWSRALALFGVGASTFFFYRSTTSSGWQGLVNLAVAFAVISALTVVGAGRFAIAFILAFVAAFDGTGARAVVAAFFIAAGFAAAIPIAAAGTAVVAVAVVVCTNVAIRSIQDMMARRGLKGLFYIIFLPVMLGLLAVAISNASWFPPELGSFISSLFSWFFLPLTNSIFDWLSLAATRGLLKGIAERDDTPALRVAWNALLGLFLGVLLLAGLAIAVTAGLQTVNLLSQGHDRPEFFDLAGSLQRLRAAPADPAVWWVYFTLFSTMLPTVFHAAVASASFVTWRLPDSWKRHWLDLIGTGETSRTITGFWSAWRGA